MYMNTIFNYKKKKKEKIEDPIHFYIKSNTKY